MRRNVTIVVALVLAVVGLVGFATAQERTRITQPIATKAGHFAVMPGLGGPAEDGE